MTNPVCPTTGAPMQRGVRPMTLDYKRARGLRDAGLVLLCGRRERPYRRGHEGLRPPPSIAFDGLVDAAFFDKMSNQWREEQNRCQREIDRHRSAEQPYMDEGVQILELARNAQRLFKRQEASRLDCATNSRESSTRPEGRVSSKTWSELDRVRRCPVTKLFGSARDTNPSRHA
jgi:hypothetical protein